MDLVKLQSVLDNTAFAVLFTTMLVYWVSAAFPRVPYLMTLGTAGMAIANLCIAALLGARWIDAGYFPLSNLYESLFFLTWGITAIHFVAETMSNSRLVGAVTAPVAMGITAFAALTLPKDMQASEPLVPALKSNWLMMHVSVMMLSYATLMVGALLAIAFLVVTRGQAIELKGSSIGTGAYRDKAYKLHRPDAALPTESVASPPTLANATGNTAVLDLPAVAATPTATLSPQRQPR
jgi:cytochrome c-type biogenesis protein CcsB